jgi:segregation and condensation protein A
MYQLTLEKFTGPLDLLLNLVEEQKLSINEISLANITEEYIQYLKSLEEMSKEELAAFLVIAATLMLIKSRSLIPNLKLSEEEETDIKELEIRLKTYQFFKELSNNLKGIVKSKCHLFGREAYAGMAAVFFPPDDLTAENLNKTLKEILAFVPQKELLSEASMLRTVSLEDKIAELKDRLEGFMEYSFDEMRKHAKEKVEVIVGFLAMLELIKQGFILFEQKNLFGSINLKKNG